MTPHSGSPVPVGAERPPVDVIASKLAPHRLPRGLISRPQLLEMLRTGRDRSLTLVSAPAGFGKTTVLTEWVATQNQPRTPFAWVSLDAADADPVRLWTHVIAAMARAQHTKDDPAMVALRTYPDRIIESVLPVLFNALADADRNVVLILDDYHLAESPTVDEQIRWFIRYRPPQVQFVVATRSDPALGLARLRVSEQLAEVRADALSFDAPEVSEFFDAVGVDLSETDKQRLTVRTGGWAAPLRLAALLIPETDRDSFIDSFSGGSRPVVDYLTRDVLDVLAPDVRDFLLQVSVLGRLTGPLCDAVVGTSASGEMLAGLERANLFVSADVAGEWYQQHQLFSECLRLELARSTPELLPVLHARAATWFATSGDLETATDHAIAARDVTRAAPLVAGQVQPMFATGRSGTIRRWLTALSWPEAMDDPELAYVRAIVASLDNEVDVALDQLARARRGPAEQEDAAGLPLAYRVDYLEALLAVSHVARAEAAARRAIKTAPSSKWRGVALAGLGQSLSLQGRLDEAVEALREAVGAISEANPILLAVAVGNLGLAESARGDTSSRADPLLDDLWQVISSIEIHRTWVGALLLLARGERDRRRGDLRSALECFTDAIGIQSPRGTWTALAYLMRARVERNLGNQTTAAGDLDMVEKILTRIPDSGNLRDRCERLRLMLAAPVRPASVFGDQLTDRELDVLRLSATSLNQRDIAAQLFISYNTVKSHLKTSYRKLGVSSRGEAVRRLRILEGHLPDGGQESPG